MALELIDTQTTDSNGEASITYTGTGAGEIEFRAKVSTLLQETFVIKDGLFLDIGTTGSPTATWYKSTSLSAERINTGTVLTMSSGQSFGFYRANNNNKVTLPFAVEFDIVNVVNTPRARFLCDNNVSINYGDLSVGHYKFIVTETDCMVSVDNGTPTHFTALENTSKTNGVTSFFELDADSDGLTYKNYVIYYI